MSKSLALALLLPLLGACTPSTGAPPALAAFEPKPVAPSDSAERSPVAAPVAAVSDTDAALAEVRAAFGEHGGVGRFDRRRPSLQAELEAIGVSEAKLTGWAVRIYAGCLASKEDRPEACAAARDGSQGDGERELHARTVLELLGAAADPATSPGGATPAARLLLSLEARGVYEAQIALDRLLERRAEIAAPRSCVPPTVGEIAEASRSLDDFLVIDLAGGGRPRALAPQERQDLAYLLAATKQAGPALMSFTEDPHAPPLAANDPAHAHRAALRDAMRLALLDGDPEAHLSAATAYLESLGYPGPIRENEEGDERWGGKGYAYALRAAARTAELAGDLARASEFARRANPGGGMCGTTFPSRRDAQLRQIVRVDEQRAGCAATVPERLFGVASDFEVYGPGRLTESGYDVARLYRGALLTLGRSDRAELEQRLAKHPRALARLARLGTEDWAERTRALRGHADTEGRAAVARLFAIARGSDGLVATQALDAIADLVQDVGFDPCGLELSGRGTWSSLQPRTVRPLDERCATKVDPATRRRWVRELGSMLRHPEVDRRVAAAEALGQAGSIEAVQLLQKVALVDDLPDTDGCLDTHADCVPSYPVRVAAARALAEYERMARIREDRAKLAELRKGGDEEGEGEAAEGVELGEDALARELREALSGE